MESLDTNFPVRHRKISFESKGNKTEIVICSYEDHILVIATQIGALGTILHARKEQGMSVEPTFSVSVIFGKRDEPMLTATARRLIEHIRWNTRKCSSKSHSDAISFELFSSVVPSKPLVLSLGLKDHSAETLKEIVTTVIENRIW
ncbi:PREDICTED: proteasome assembly chaperone 3 isoform X1 [Camelina sativa]|uniref:Proteasome assembly chaperone 3 isoform X1 n=1 Tax=Camelina sativa TaxID=90675 RepID=A0ABM1QV43_CAMSA|nr:PREDICTED: proteasome assembly chaperone 3 isoform X1 [Camelina sativa]